MFAFIVFWFIIVGISVVVDSISGDDYDKDRDYC